MNEETKKNWIIALLTIIIVLLITLIILVIFQSKKANDNTNTNQNYNSGETKKTPDEPKKTPVPVTKEEELALSDPTVQKLVNKITPLKNYPSFTYYNPEYPSKYFALLYKEDTLYSKDIPAKVKSLLTVRNTNYKNEEAISGCEYKVKEETLQKSYQELFGQNTTYELAEYNEWMPLLRKEKTEWIVGACGGDTQGPGYNIYSKMIRSTKKDDEIYLYEAITLADETDMDNQTNTFDFYSDINHSNLIANTTKEQIFESYLTSLPKYKYTFKLENNNYYFYKIEKVAEK